jgi:hypothetical protein
MHIIDDYCIFIRRKRNRISHQRILYRKKAKNAKYHFRIETNSMIENILCIQTDHSIKFKRIKNTAAQVEDVRRELDGFKWIQLLIQVLVSGYSLVSINFWTWKRCPDMVVVSSAVFDRFLFRGKAWMLQLDTMTSCDHNLFFAAAW